MSFNINEAGNSCLGGVESRVRRAHSNVQARTLSTAQGHRPPRPTRLGCPLVHGHPHIHDLFCFTYLECLSQILQPGLSPQTWPSDQDLGPSHSFGGGYQEALRGGWEVTGRLMQGLPPCWPLLPPPSPPPSAGKGPSGHPFLQHLPAPPRRVGETPGSSPGLFLGLSPWPWRRWRAILLYQAES